MILLPAGMSSEMRFPSSVHRGQTKNRRSNAVSIHYGEYSEDVPAYVETRQYVYGHADMLSAILSAIITRNTLMCVQCKLMLVHRISMSPHTLLNTMRLLGPCTSGGAQWSCSENRWRISCRCHKDLKMSLAEILWYLFQVASPPTWVWAMHKFKYNAGWQHSGQICCDINAGHDAAFWYSIWFVSMGAFQWGLVCFYGQKEYIKHFSLVKLKNFILGSNIVIGWISVWLLHK